MAIPEVNPDGPNWRDQNQRKLVYTGLPQRDGDLPTKSDWLLGKKKKKKKIVQSFEQ
jgi:hypothetical protein